MNTNTPKQRFVALRVREVSLVDRPANDEEFMVVKRAPLATDGNKLPEETEKNMATKNTAKTSTTAPATGEQTTTTETAKGDTASTGVQPTQGMSAAGGSGEEGRPEQGDLTEKALADLEEQRKALDEKIAKAKAAKGKAAKEQGDDEEDVGKGAKPTVDPKTAAPAGNSRPEQDDLTKTKKELEEAAETLKGILATIDAAKGKLPPALQAHLDAKNGKGKGKDGEDDEEEKKAKKAISDEIVQKMVDPQAQLLRSMVYALQDNCYQMLGLLNLDVDKLDTTAEKSVAKGVKQMSAQRMEKFKAALSHLQDLAKDFSPPEDSTDGVKPLAPQTVQGTTNSLPAAKPGYSAESNVTKAITDALAPLVQQVAEVAKRVEKIETVRGVTKSVAEGDTTETPVQKSKGFWTGIV